MLSEQQPNNTSDVEKSDQVKCKSNETQQQEDDDLEKVKVKKPRMYPVRSDLFLHKNTNFFIQCMKF